MRTVRLGDIVDIQLGKMLSPASKTGLRPLPYLRNANVQWDRFDLADVYEMDFDSREEQKFLLRPGDVLVCEGGEPGRAAVWNGAIDPCLYQKALHRLRPISDAVDPQYLVYRLWLGANRGEFADGNAKTTIAHLPAVRLAELQVQIPPIEEQRRVASRLTHELQAVEHAQHRLRERLTQTRLLRDIVLKAAFEGPEATHCMPLGRTGTLQDGDWILTADYAATGVRLLQVGDVGRGALLAKSNRYISENRAAELKCTVLRTGDILISRMPDPIGRACVVPDLGYQAITAVDVTIFRPNTLILDTEYAVRFMNSRSWLRAVAAKASGATRARISRMNLELLAIPLPSLDIQRRIASELRERLDAIDAIEGSLQVEREAINALPGALLRRAFGNPAA